MATILPLGMMIPGGGMVAVADVNLPDTMMIEMTDQGDRPALHR